MNGTFFVFCHIYVVFRSAATCVFYKLNSMMNNTDKWFKSYEYLNMWKMYNLNVPVKYRECGIKCLM